MKKAKIELTHRQLELLRQCVNYCASFVYREEHTKEELRALAGTLYQTQIKNF